MAIEIVEFPIKNGDFPISYVKLPEGISPESRAFGNWEPDEATNTVPEEAVE